VGSAAEGGRTEERREERVEKEQSMKEATCSPITSCSSFTRSTSPDCQRWELGLKAQTPNPKP